MQLPVERIIAWPSRSNTPPLSQPCCSRVTSLSEHKGHAGEKWLHSAQPRAGAARWMLTRRHH